MIPLPPWLEPQKKYLLALSGGRDSVCLLHLLRAQGFENIIPCHLNHQLRGVDAEADEAFVRNLCAELGLSCEISRVEVAVVAEKEKKSLETAARDCRRQFFAACATKHQTADLLLAHHADDQAETILFNLLRGSAGLKGMREMSRQIIGGQKILFLRPLLNIRRADIDLFLQKNKIFFREDATNQDSFATRNRLRHEALPLLANILKRDPVPNLLRAAALQCENDRLIDHSIDALELFDPQGRLFLPKLRLLDHALQKRALHHFLTKNKIPQVSEALIIRALDLISTDSAAALTLPGGRRLRRKEGRIFIV